MVEHSLLKYVCDVQYARFHVEWFKYFISFRFAKLQIQKYSLYFNKQTCAYQKHSKALG